MSVIVTESVVVPIPDAMLNDLDVDVWGQIQDYILPDIAQRLGVTLDRINITGRVAIKTGPDVEQYHSVTPVFGPGNDRTTYTFMEYDVTITD